MMGLHFADIFFRLLPEAYLMIYFIFMLSKKNLSLIRFLISGIVIALLVYIVRLLPIYFGIHMVINLVLYISIVNINGISLVKSICNSLIAMITLSICEIINFLLLNIFNINYYDNEYIIKSMLGIPSLLIFILIIVLIKIYIKNKGQK